jgi:hypothetical protein
LAPGPLIPITETDYIDIMTPFYLCLLGFIPMEAIDPLLEGIDRKNRMNPFPTPNIVLQNLEE